MLDKEVIEKISGLLKIDGKTLAEAIANTAEVAIEIPDLTVFTAAEIATRDKHKYEEGKTAGVDILIKDWKEKNGIEIDGKDPVKFLDAYKAKALKDANVEPDKKLAEAEKVAETLRANLAKAESERDALNGSMRSMQLQSRALAGVEADYLLSKEKVLHLMTAEGYSLDEENGAVIFKQNGAPVRDHKTQDVLPASKVFEAFAVASNLAKTEPTPPRGRGAGSSKTPQSDPTSFSQLKEQWEAEGKSINSAEFSARAQELAKTNTDFFNS